MISAFFVDRPRLAVVVAAVITIAGLLALTRIPVAQLPDIVPPQVQVSATYPGASAAVVEASVAQPIEAQVVGVDKMLYMKSTSPNDGSYNLTVSFALDSDPRYQHCQRQQPRGAGWSHWCTPDRAGPTVSSKHPNAGSPDDLRAVRQYRPSRESRRLPVACA
jgi:hypothetical protein